MKGDLTLQLLESVGSAGKEVFELFDTFLAAGYGASLGKIEATRRRRAKERSRASQRAEQEDRARRQYRNLLYRLKQSDFLQTDRRGIAERLTLTLKGKVYLQRLRKRPALPQPHRYHRQDGNAFIIVVFDVPEKERRKRDWLRSVLKHLGLKMIQKSVWVGKTKIPESFLKDLKELRLLPFVEIFAVTKTGNLRTL